MKTTLSGVLFVFGLSALLLTGCAITPEPFSENEHWRAAMDAKSTLYQNQPPLDGPLSLSQAIVRAMTYDYDSRLAMMEGVFQSRELAVANLGMLPKLTASAGYTARDKENASRSISYFTRKETLEPSVSQERQRVIADLSFNWSILDFGISYFQAKQYADRYLIMEERRRRVVNNIVKDVITAYWSAAMSELLLPQVRLALAETEKALTRYGQARSSGLTSLMRSLEEEKRLLQISSGLKRVAADLTQSRIHLAALVNLPMDEPYSIVLPDEKNYANPPALPDNIGMVEDLALYLRPDMREDSYQERIDKNELNKEIVRMIPGVSLVVSANYDSNTFIHHNAWTEGTTRIASNLLGLFGNYYQYKAAETQIEVTRTRKLANMVAALVQVRLAYHQYATALQDYRDNLALHDLEQQIYAITHAESEDGSISELEQINRHTDLIAVSMAKFYALRSVYEAWGNFYFSLGGNLVKDLPEEATLEEKTELIQSGLERWWGGSLPTLPDFESEQDSLEEAHSSQQDIVESEPAQVLQPLAPSAPQTHPDPVSSRKTSAPEIKAMELFDYVWQTGSLL